MSANDKKSEIFSYFEKAKGEFRGKRHTQGSYAILKINFQTFSKPTFLDDLPRSNTGTVIFNTI